MTQAQAQAQASQYERALARAAAAGIKVIGVGKVKATSGQCVAVTSATSDTAHLVRVVGSQLVCDCKAATAGGRYCMHRAMARQALEARAAAQAAAKAQRQRWLSDAMWEKDCNQYGW